MAAGTLGLRRLFLSRRIRRSLSEMMKLKRIRLVTITVDFECQLGTVNERAGRTSSWIGLFPEIHCRDKVVLEGEHVQNLALREHLTMEAPDELMNPDSDLTIISLSEIQGFNVRIKITPLPRPVSADFFFPDSLASF